MLRALSATIGRKRAPRRNRSSRSSAVVPPGPTDGPARVAHLRAAIRQHERRPGTAAFQRRHHGRHHHRAVALATARRAIALGLVSLPRRRCGHETGRPRTERPLHRRGQRAAHGRPYPHHRPVDRHRVRQSRLGREIRPRAGRNLHGPGPRRADDREHARRPGAGFGRGASAPQAAGEPGRLRMRAEGKFIALGRSRRAGGSHSLVRASLWRSTRAMASPTRCWR